MAPRSRCERSSRPVRPGLHTQLLLACLLVLCVSGVHATGTPPQGSTPPAGGGTPPQGGTPPAGGGTPPQGGTPPAGGGTPPQGSTPPAGGGTPPGAGTPPAGGSGGGGGSSKTAITVCVYLNPPFVMPTSWQGETLASLLKVPAMRIPAGLSGLNYTRDTAGLVGFDLDLVELILTQQGHFTITYKLYATQLDALVGVLDGDCGMVVGGSKLDATRAACADLSKSGVVETVRCSFRISRCTAAADLFSPVHPAPSFSDPGTVQQRLRAGRVQQPVGQHLVP